MDQFFCKIQNSLINKLACEDCAYNCKTMSDQVKKQLEELKNIHIVCSFFKTCKKKSIMNCKICLGYVVNSMVVSK